MELLGRLTLLDVLLMIGAISAGVGAVIKFWRTVLSPILGVIRDWQGEPAREGVEARPGVMERLARFEKRQAAIETKQGDGSRERQSLADTLAVVRDEVKVIHHEVLPNGGGSLKDDLSEVKGTLEKVEKSVASLAAHRRTDRQKLIDHIDAHGGI